MESCGCGAATMGSASSSAAVLVVFISGVPVRLHDVEQRLQMFFKMLPARHRSLVDRLSHPCHAGRFHMAFVLVKSQAVFIPRQSDVIEDASRLSLGIRHHVLITQVEYGARRQYL